MRVAEISRKTAETDISLCLTLEGTGKSNIATAIICTLGYTVCDYTIFDSQAATVLIDIATGIGSHTANNTAVLQDSSSLIVNTTTMGGRLTSYDLTT